MSGRFSADTQTITVQNLCITRTFNCQLSIFGLYNNYSTEFKNLVK